MDMYASTCRKASSTYKLIQGLRRDHYRTFRVIKAPVLAFAPVPALPTGAGKKARGLRIIIRHLLPTI
jgi:hypothetical protein